MKNTNEQILELSKLVDAGRISQEEFNVLKKEALEKNANDGNLINGWCTLATIPEEKEEERIDAEPEIVSTDNRSTIQRMSDGIDETYDQKIYPFLNVAIPVGGVLFILFYFWLVSRTGF